MLLFRALFLASWQSIHSYIMIEHARAGDAVLAVIQGIVSGIMTELS